ncbi:MAG: RNA methyltransferase [Eubacterium sp.]|nr:RNA methyltransferase [Eubacterium sp.]
MITSTSNDKIKYMEKLRKSASFRREEGLFPVEGIRMVREIPKDRLVQLFYTEKAYERYGAEFGLEVETVSEQCMKKMSDTDTPQGILAAVRMKNYTLEDILDGDDGSPFILVLEKLQDPGNLGTIIRTAEAAGVTGIMISSDSADIYNPKTIRSTMGALFRMRIYISDDLLRDVAELKKKGIVVYAMHLNGEEFYDKDFKKPSAFLIGNEGNGLSDELSHTADEMMRIPMLGKVESLNAAISASVVSYEVFRQRH